MTIAKKDSCGVYIIAGEASGDNIGAKLMLELESHQNIKIIGGIGGEKMIAQGLKSLFPMQDLSVMGYIEIMPKLLSLRKRILHTAEDIISLNPDIVITIDSPGFCFRVVSKVKKLLNKTKFIHYVAPTVWAYKEKRSKKTAELYDHLLTILPFEEKYFSKEGLDSTFVGHPLTHSPLGDGARFRRNHKLSPEDFVLCVSPGSRLGEVCRLIPIFIEAVNEFLKLVPDAIIVVPTFHHMEEFVKEKCRKITTDKVIISSDMADKRDLINASDLALTKCGTITNEFAFNNVPMIAAYKINPITAFFIRRMIKIKHISLINILSDEEIVKEYIQENCTAEKIYEGLKQMYEDASLRKLQLEKMQSSIKKLYNNENESPSKIAANVIINLCKKGICE